MAGMFGGALIGNFGSQTGGDITPFLRMQQMQQQQSQFERSMQDAMAAREQDQNVALSQLEFNRQSMLAKQAAEQMAMQQSGQQFQQEQARLGAATQGQQELGKLGLAQEAEEARMNQERLKAQMGLQAADSAEEKRRYSDAQQRTAARDSDERARYEAEQRRLRQKEQREAEEFERNKAYQDEVLAERRATREGGEGAKADVVREKAALRIDEMLGDLLEIADLNGDQALLKKVVALRLRHGLGKDVSAEVEALADEMTAEPVAAAPSGQGLSEEEKAKRRAQSAKEDREYAEALARGER